MERRADTRAWSDGGRIDPAMVLASLALFSAVIWIAVPALTRLAPPLDVVEGYMWGREWPLLTYKHPALPAWVIEASRIVTFGAIGWPIYVASQLFLLATLTFVFLLARDLVGDERALLAVLPLLVFEHFAWRSPEFNHTIAQFPFWAAVALFSWRAAERGTWTAWLCLALAMAGGVYTKFSHGLIVVIAAAWLLYDPRARRQLGTPKPWLAAALAVVLVAPIAIWFSRNGMLPLEYARSRAAEPSASAVTFLARATLTALPMIAVLALAVGLARRNGTALVEKNSANSAVRRFAVAMTLGPLLLSVLLATLSGSGLRTTWSAPVLILLPLALTVLVPRLSIAGNIRPLAVILAVAIVGIAVGDAGRLFLSRSTSDGPSRANWPEKAIAAAAAAAWSKEVTKPLRIVAGDTWPAGLVGTRHPDRPSILTSGDMTLSPWITSELLVRDGAFVVFEPKRTVPEPLKALMGDRQPKPLEFYAAGRASGAQLSYVIVPPRP